MWQAMEAFYGVPKCADAIRCQCGAGQIEADDSVRALQKKGIRVVVFIGAKDALTKIRNLNTGMPDTGTYFTDEEFTAGFKKSMEFQPSVISKTEAHLVKVFRSSA